MTLSFELQRKQTILVELNRDVRELPTLDVVQGLGKKAVLFTHPELKLHADPIVDAFKAAGKTVFIYEIPSGEGSKSLQHVQSCLTFMLENRLARDDFVVGLGGGVIGDLSGFVASIYLRGIRFINVPTTLLAQVDSAIGGKTGVNHALGKNLIGTFYQPVVTFIDPQFLNTLPKAELLNGLAEVIKYGVIRNPDLFAYLEQHHAQLSELTYATCPDCFDHIIAESVNDKLDVVRQDEQESGLRGILNFGHTVGHALEALKGYSNFSHGQGVVLGMKAASYLSVKEGYLDEATHHRIVQLISRFDYDVDVDGVDLDAIFDKLFLDKKVKGGRLRFTLAKGIGSVFITDQFKESHVKLAIASILKES